MTSGLGSLGIGLVFSSAGQWVASGAQWLLAQVGTLLSATTGAGLGTSWFDAHEHLVAAIGAALVLPLACCAAVQAIWRQSPGLLARAVLVQLPVALLATGVALSLVRSALAVTDALSGTVLRSSGADAGNLFGSVAAMLAPAAGDGTSLPSFVLFFGGLVIAVAAFGLWLELVVRSAALDAAVLFLPMVLAATVWPALGHWCRRLCETIAALVLSKFVIAAILALGVAAVNGAASGDGGVSAAVTGMALLVLASVAPFVLLRLVPAADSLAASGLEGARHRLRQPLPVLERTGSLAVQMASAAAAHGSSGAAPVVPGVSPAGSSDAAPGGSAPSPSAPEPPGPAGAAGPAGGGGVHGGSNDEASRDSGTESILEGNREAGKILKRYDGPAAGAESPGVAGSMRETPWATATPDEPGGEARREPPGG